MAIEKHPDKEEILLEITCKIKKQADSKTSINSNKVRFYPDNRKQIYICEHGEALINQTCKSLAIEAVKSENNFARVCLPIDTRLIGCLQPSYQASVAKSAKQVEKSLEQLFELQKIIVTKKERSAITPDTKIEVDDEPNIPEISRVELSGNLPLLIKKISG